MANHSRNSIIVESMLRTFGQRSEHTLTVLLWLPMSALTFWMFAWAVVLTILIALPVFALTLRGQVDNFLVFLVVSVNLYAHLRNSHFPRNLARALAMQEVLG